ncbi:hypothetical protein B0J11DRAFT_190976 [Dendryphion nanum]|uniref:Ubiquinol-cytochrome-c reductase cytochrome c1 n=1 Tax=Dendryphion nanum TaxID=256645 RepID=A0A9P9D3M4_9PLEO|nr:hypothetical protein B0J11DRAFT_190976 [Dendryphion nanum]
MAQNVAGGLPDQEQVYSAFKEVFDGQNASIRKLKAVQRNVQKCQSKEAIQNMIKQHGMGNICQAVKSLLEEGIFASMAKAQLRFPNFFEKFSDQQPAFGRESTGFGVESVDEDQSIAAAMDSNPEETQDNAIPTCRPQSRSQTHTYTSLSHLVCLPFVVHHQLLVTTQETLEKACYAFAEKSLGGVLQREGWECAEAVELNRWTDVFQIYQNEFNPEGLKRIGMPFHDLLGAVTKLRHTAVHRIHITAKEVSELVYRAELLAILLQEEAYVQKISDLRSKTETMVDKLEKHKVSLESRLAETRRLFASKKADLEMQERDAMEKLLQEGKIPLSFENENPDEATSASNVDAYQNQVNGEMNSDDEFYEISATEAHIPRCY